MLKGKIALVTGAGRGIGRETAVRLACYGAQVVVNYFNSEEKAAETLEYVKQAGGSGMLCRADIKDGRAVKEMFEKVVEVYGRIDILVNNAGITKDNLIVKMSEAEFDAVMQTNLKGVYYCLQQASKIMLKQKSGRIVNVSSVCGVYGNAGQVNYCASKAGVIGMTKSLSKELGSRGITVNAVAPGFIETDMTDSLSAKVKEALISSIALKRFGKTEDIAEAICFLASDRASYITGQVLVIDGGM